MKKGLLILIGVLVLLAMTSACAPKAAPPPAPTPRPISTPTPISAVPAPSPQDAVWAQVVEAAKKEGRLVIYGSSAIASAGKEIAAAFTARYGIPVDTLVLGGRQQVEKLKVERGIGKPIADVVQTGTSSATEIVLGGLGESAVEALPVLRDRSVFHVDPVYGPQQQILTFAVLFVGPVISTNLVRPDEIKSWHDLLNPKWKGKMLMSDPRSTGTGLNIFSTMTYYKVLDYDYFRRLAQQQLTLWGGSQREGWLMIARGEYDIDIGGAHDKVAPMIMEGAPLRMVPVEEGNIGQLDAVMLAKGAPHPNAARLFLNWFLTPEGQEAYHKTVGSLPMRKDMPDFTHEKARFTPKKIWSRTWDAAEQSNKDLKSGILEQIFGKK